MEGGEQQLEATQQGCFGGVERGLRVQEHAPEGQVGQTAGQELPQAALTRQPRSAPNTHDSFNTNWSDRIFPLGDQPFL